jgi:hypothetical protein
MLFARMRTTGLVEAVCARAKCGSSFCTVIMTCSQPSQKFGVHGLPVSMSLTGGQLSERKKWLHVLGKKGQVRVDENEPHVQMVST